MVERADKEFGRIRRLLDVDQFAGVAEDHQLRIGDVPRQLQAWT
jgi:hypothetical protein